jgi:hypothetical protein
MRAEDSNSRGSDRAGAGLNAFAEQLAIIDERVVSAGKA